MDLVEAGDFLRWAAGHSIVPDPAFREWPGQAPLRFATVPPCWRRWIAPEAPFNLPSFASCLLACAAPKSTVYLFIKGSAPWFTGSDATSGPEWEYLRDRIVGTLPIPRDFCGALKLAPSETDDAVLLMVTFLVYAWCVTDDLQIIAERGDVIVQTSHHGDVVVHCSNEARLKSVVSCMLERGFTPFDEEQT